VSSGPDLPEPDSEEPDPESGEPELPEPEESEPETEPGGTADAASAHDGGRYPFMVSEDIVEGAEPYPRKYVGLCVSFDLQRTGGKITRERGEITDQRWLGFTRRGQIPEYEITVLGKTGRKVLARITRDRVHEL
jgi:hypothetical protein